MFIGATDSRGTVVIPRLSVGQYYVSAVHDGLEAGKEWIQVVATPDSKTVKRLKFEWADWSYETSRVAGILTGYVLGNTGNKLMDIARPVETVYPGVDLMLKRAFSDDEYRGWFADAVSPVGIQHCNNVEKLIDIQPNGEANFCVDFPDYSFGNVKEMSIEALWNSERAERFRLYRRARPLAVCYRCGAKFMSEIGS